MASAKGKKIVRSKLQNEIQQGKPKKKDMPISMPRTLKDKLKKKGKK